MTIELKKFGTILVSRQLGKEAYAAYAPTLAAVKPDEPVTVAFDGVEVLSPSWADEFLTPLQRAFGDRLTLGATDNPSAAATIAMLERANGFVFKR